MKRFVILLISFLAISYFAYGQQTTQYSQYYLNQALINPAATGHANGSQLFMGFRKQWLGVQTSPTSVHAGINKVLESGSKKLQPTLALRTSRADEFSTESNLDKKRMFRHAVGVNFNNDSYGAFQSSGLNFNYAIQRPLSNRLNVSAGLNLAYKNLNFDESRAVPENIQDNFYQSFAINMASGSRFDVNLGVYLSSNALFVGYSTNQLTGGALRLNTLNPDFFRTHHSLIGGYKYQTGTNLSLQPIVHLKYVSGAPITYDLNLLAELMGKFYSGIGLRNQDAMILMLGIKTQQKFNISYSSDINISQMRRRSLGGHEIIISYSI